MDNSTKPRETLSKILAVMTEFSNRILIWLGRTENWVDDGVEESGYGKIFLKKILEIWISEKFWN